MKEFKKDIPRLRIYIVRYDEIMTLSTLLALCEENHSGQEVPVVLSFDVFFVVLA